MKIRKLHLKNYKVFDDLELDFTDADGNTLNQVVLAGLNGTGKTTVLEFLRNMFGGYKENFNTNFQLQGIIDVSNHSESLYNIFRREYNTYSDGNYDESDLERGKYAPITINKPIKTDSSSQYILNTIQRDFVYRYTSDIIYRYSNDKTRREILNTDSKVEKITKELNLPEQTVHEYFDTKGNKCVVKEISFATHKDEMKDLILKPIKNKVFENKNLPPKKVIQQEIDDINKVFEGIKRNSHFIDIDDDNLIFKSANGKRINFEQLSSGEKYVYFMGFMLKRMNINNSIIMIDEPEDSLHPTWQSQILKFYSNIGENNQVILATHSPHIIGSAKAESVFLLKAENDMITVSHPKYSEGHSIPYVLSEVMEADYRNTYTNNIINEYLELIRTGKHETEAGQQLATEIKKLDANSEERRRVDLSLRRFKAVGK